MDGVLALGARVGVLQVLDDARLAEGVEAFRHRRRVDQVTPAGKEVSKRISASSHVLLPAEFACEHGVEFSEGAAFVHGIGACGRHCGG